MFRKIPLYIIRSFHCTQGNVIYHTSLLTSRKLSANLYDICHYCVYSERLLMMERETV